MEPVYSPNLEGTNAEAKIMVVYPVYTHGHVVVHAWTTAEDAQREAKAIGMIAGGPVNVYHRYGVTS